MDPLAAEVEVVKLEKNDDESGSDTDSSSSTITKGDFSVSSSSLSSPPKILVSTSVQTEKQGRKRKRRPRKRKSKKLAIADTTPISSIALNASADQEQCDTAKEDHQKHHQQSISTSRMSNLLSTLDTSDTKVLGGNRLVEGGEISADETVTIPAPMETEATEDVTSSQDVENGHSVSEVGVNDIESYYCFYDITKDSQPVCVSTTAEKEFSSSSYLKGCKWAPDGSCLLSCTDDNLLKLFNLPASLLPNAVIEDGISSNNDSIDTWTSVLSMKEGGQVYDYSWYPRMSSLDPVTSCFLATSNGAPVHLWDAFSGTLRGSYCAFNHLDELVSAKSVAFDPTGELIYCGFNKTVRIFDITRPGRECTVRQVNKHVLPDLRQSGIVSCIAVNPRIPSMYACGSYHKSVGLYVEDGSVLTVVEAHKNGVTHLMFSHDGGKLFSGGRKDSRLICWDLRNMGDAYEIYDRIVDTHQRIYFDITPRNEYLISGETDGNIKIWDLRGTETPLEGFRFSLNFDCINGVSVNPFLNIIATSSGQRHFEDVADDGDKLFVSSKAPQTKDIKLWKITND